MIGEQITRINSQLPNDVQLVAVSKFHPVSALQEAYAAGQRVFGESRAQELAVKYPQMPNDVQWHFIGHLQTNKVRAIVPYVAMIHSVDSQRLLECLDVEARRLGKVVNVLLQLHVAQETTKYGFTCDECLNLAARGVFASLKNLRVCGVMGMATNTEDEDAVREEFRAVKRIFEQLKVTYFAEQSYFNEVSMGMSDDYLIAIEEGSTMVRIGSTIFGNREY